MQLLGYQCVNDDKVNRAIYGSTGSEGKLHGGVGENASDEAKIAEYDRLGGLITKDGHKVKTGSFYDFDKRAPRKEPEVVLLFRDISGQIVELAEGEELPITVKAAEIAKAQVKGKKVKKND